MNTILRLSEVTKRILLTECSVGSWPKVAAHFNFLGVSYGHFGLVLNWWTPRIGA